MWCHNLGPSEQVAEILAQWLGSIDCGEQEMDMSERKPHGAVPREMREKRVEEREQKRDEDARAEDEALDDAVRRSIKDHGA
jgi:hypothetical protein